MMALLFAVMLYGFSATVASGSMQIGFRMNHQTIERRLLEQTQVLDRNTEVVQTAHMMEMNKHNTLSSDKETVEEMNYLFEHSMNKVQMLTQQYSNDIDKILKDALEESARLKQTLMSRAEVEKANAALDTAMQHINEMSDNFHDHIIDSISKTVGEVGAGGRSEQAEKPILIAEIMINDASHKDVFCGKIAEKEMGFVKACKSERIISMSRILQEDDDKMYKVTLVLEFETNEQMEVGADAMTEVAREAAAELGIEVGSVVTRVHEVSESPTLQPSNAPTTCVPTACPTIEPTPFPTHNPTIDPTPEPTESPTEEPTIEPTQEPTSDPTTDVPTKQPSTEPTIEPTMDPTIATDSPTPDPTVEPTEDPTPDPTIEPSEEPTPEPTEDPTPEPTEDPVPDPTEEPTPEPTEPEPTEEPTPKPTKADPTPKPTEAPKPTPAPTAEETWAEETWAPAETWEDHSNWGYYHTEEPAGGANEMAQLGRRDF